MKSGPTLNLENSQAHVLKLIKTNQTSAILTASKSTLTICAINRHDVTT